MKIRMFFILALLAMAVVIAGCAQIPLPTPPVPALTPEQTTAALQTTQTSTLQPSFTLGDHYLKKSYAFNDMKDVYIEDIRMDNTSWGIGFDVLPLTDNVTESWFVMKVTNRDSGQTDLYGYGGAYGYERQHLIPRYTSGAL